MALVLYTAMTKHFKAMPEFKGGVEPLTALNVSVYYSSGKLVAILKSGTDDTSPPHTLDYKPMSPTTASSILNEIPVPLDVSGPINKWFLSVSKMVSNCGSTALLKTVPPPGSVMAPEADKDTPVVPLKNASKLYQLVGGTDVNSRYVTVAIAPGLCVAARYKKDTLSIRAEGDRVVGDLSKSLISLGLQPSKAGHKSMHLKCATITYASRALGAVLSSVGIDFKTPVPNYNKVLTKGHGS